MRKKNNQKLIISLFVLLLLSIGIVYAYLTSNLSITGSTRIANNSWDIHFDNLVVSEGSVDIGSGYQAALINPTDNTKISYNVLLSAPGDYYEFTVKIVNDGSINGKISLVTLSGIDSQYEDIIKYSVKYVDGSSVNVGDIVNAGTKKRIVVRVYYEDNINSADLPTSNIDLNLEFNVTYNQTRDEADRSYVSTSNVNSYVSANGTCKRTIPAGTEIEVLEISDDWVKVNAGQSYDEWIFIWNNEDLTDLLNVVHPPGMEVYIFSDRKSVMLIGETVHLTSYLYGFEGYIVSYQWECDKDDGNGFQPVEGATEDHYEFPASKESLGWGWVLSVSYRAQGG